MITRTFIECMKSKLNQGWLQRDYAQKADGQSCRVDDPEAAKWCVVGAAYACSHESDPGRQVPSFRVAPQVSQFMKVFRETHNINAMFYNDDEGRTLAEMLAALDALPVEDVA